MGNLGRSAFHCITIFTAKRRPIHTLVAGQIITLYMIATPTQEIVQVHLIGLIPFFRPQARTVGGRPVIFLDRRPKAYPLESIQRVVVGETPK